MLRWLLSLFICAHAHRVRERIDGRLMLTCAVCGDTVPALTRTPAELREFRRTKPSHETLKARPSQPGRVLAMRGRAK